MVLCKKASAGLHVLPVIVSITESSDWNSERLPNRVEGVFHHLSLMADRKPLCSENKQKHKDVKALHSF